MARQNKNDTVKIQRTICILVVPFIFGYAIFLGAASQFGVRCKVYQKAGIHNSHCQISFGRMLQEISIFCEDHSMYYYYVLIFVRWYQWEVEYYCIIQVGQFTTRNVKFLFENLAIERIRYNLA